MSKYKTVPSEPNKEWIETLVTKGWSSGYKLDATKQRHNAQLIRDVLASAPRVGSDEITTLRDRLAAVEMELATAKTLEALAYTSYQGAEATISTMRDQLTAANARIAELEKNRGG